MKITPELVEKIPGLLALLRDPELDLPLQRVLWIDTETRRGELVQLDAQGRASIVDDRLVVESIVLGDQAEPVLARIVEHVHNYERETR